MRKMYIGIDIGSTNTVMASCKSGRRFNVSHIREISQHVSRKTIECRKTLPSVLYLTEDGEAIVGEYANHQKEIGDKHVLYNTKYQLGNNITYDLGLTPKQVTTEILKVCRTNISQVYVARNEEFPEIVLAVPATYKLAQRAELIDAAEKAGFNSNKVRMIPEPVAALCHYLNYVNLSGEDCPIENFFKKRVLVCDIGDIDLNLSLVEVTEDSNDTEKLCMQVQCSKRYPSGGFAFDENLAETILSNNAVIKNKTFRTKITRFQEDFLLL